MPTYGYRCTSCSQEFERFQKISDPAVTECETCGQPVKKILYPVGIQFKGSGFYVNDYAPKSAKSAASESAGAAAAPAGSGSPETATPSTTTTETKTPSAPPAPAAAPSPSSSSS